MSRKMDPEALEVKTQYCSMIIQLVKESIDMKRESYYWDALNHLKTTTAFILKRDDEDRDNFQIVSDLISDIRMMSATIEGPTLEIRQATVDLFRNDAAREYFDYVLEYIQEHLKWIYAQMGLGFHDPSLGRRSGI